MLKGIAASDGYGLGNAVIVKNANLKYDNKTGCNPDEEYKRLLDAVETFCEKNAKVAEEVRKNVGEKEAEIIDGHSTMARDPYMLSEMKKITDIGCCAEKALSDVCDTFIAMFSNMDDDFMKQRGDDVKDIKNDILSIMLGIEKQDISKLPSGSILVTDELTPSMTAEINPRNVCGIVTANGGKTSHAAILARTLGIPAVLSVQGGISAINNNDFIIVDGIKGIVLVNPENQKVDDYKDKFNTFINERELLKAFKNQPTVTKDGKSIELFCNIGSPDDVNFVLESTGEGVGLFRTEFLFMDRQDSPSLEEQFEIYKRIATSLKNKPVIIRTLDIGGDKDVPCLGLKKEENPFLGFRAVRYCLSNKDIFTTQLKALLKASAFGDIRIMIPLVTGISEIKAVKKLILEIKEEFDASGIDYNHDIKLGAMIETPAAAIMAEAFAKEVDFFSIGTNDLTQYTLAVDRGNSDVEYLYTPFNPAVLKLIKHIITVANQNGIPVGMCGEAAADVNMIPLLISFGLDEFSVNPASVLKTRSVISGWSKEDADQYAQKLMSLNDTDEINEFLNK